MHPIYHYAFVSDAQEGLIVVNVDTLADGEPRNNHLSRAPPGTPTACLNGARYLTLGGHIAYVLTDRALVIVDLDDPLQPRLVAEVALNDPRGAALQFRYLFVTDADGLKAVDVTDPAQPRPGRTTSCPWAMPGACSLPVPTPTSPPAAKAW
jgi:hypothetical protein